MSSKTIVHCDWCKKEIKTYNGRNTLEVNRMSIPGQGKVYISWDICTECIEDLLKGHTGSGFNAGQQKMSKSSLKREEIMRKRTKIKIGEFDYDGCEFCIHSDDGNCVIDDEVWRDSVTFDYYEIYCGCFEGKIDE